MTEFSASMDVVKPDLAIADAEPMFYVVSKRKFTILFLSTIGAYYLYWFYKNWDRYQDHSPYAAEAGTAIWPFPRAMFAIFFVHALFRKIKEHGIDKLQVRTWSDASHAGFIVLLILLYNVFDRMASRNIGSPWTDILSLLMLAPMLPAFLSAQEIINVACNDPEGRSNARLTAANYAWIVIGAIFWCLVLLGMLLPDPG